MASRLKLSRNSCIICIILEATRNSGRWSDSEAVILPDIILKQLY